MLTLNLMNLRINKGYFINQSGSIFYNVDTYLPVKRIRFAIRNFKKSLQQIGLNFGGFILVSSLFAVDVNRFQKELKISGTQKSREDFF